MFWAGQCAVDHSDRLLDDSTNFPRKNTQELCKEHCNAKNYRFAGVQFGSQCFCGNTAPPFSAVAPEEECNKVCPGDQNQMCGGTWRMNVFQLSP